MTIKYLIKVHSILFSLLFFSIPFQQFHYGSSEDLAPGLVLYKLSDLLTAQEKSVVKREWKSCLDRHGHVAPMSMYSWFSKGDAGFTNFELHFESEL